MEVLEQNLDEFFNLNPFLAEMYSNYSSSSSSGVSDHGSATAAAVDHLRMSSINSWNGQETISPSSSLISEVHPQLISFESDKYSSFSQAHHSRDCSQTPQIISFSSSAEDDLGERERAATTTRTPLQAQDHVVAERKRRDNLRQLFISLSKLVPGLKKLDKASLLEDAINYLKVLQERVTTLEKEDITSSIDTPKEDNTSSSGSPSNNSCELDPKQISVRISERHVLIKICCKKEMRLLSRIPCEMEMINLTVNDMRIMPFGGGALHVTVLAEMQIGFVGTVKDIVDHLQGFLGQI